jgi:hypothetical protein
MQMQKSGNHGKIHRTGEAGGSRNGAVPAYRYRSSI